MESIDLLNPSDLREHYRHQLRQTISAYNPTQIVLGEALQNAIDAIVEANDGGPHEININLDLDQSAVTITDNGGGFPNDPKLLFLGGGTKRSGNPKLFGLVGVGIKVVLFSSKKFRIRANSDQGAFHYEIVDAYKFDNESPPDLEVPSQFETDLSPSSNGTEVHYQFPGPTIDNPVGEFIQNMYDQCLPQGNDAGFGKTLTSAVQQGIYENRFAGLMISFLRRDTYAGDVLNRLNGKPELANTIIHMCVNCSNPMAIFGDKIGDLFDGKTQFSFEIDLKYLLFSDTYNWASEANRLGVFKLPLGPGGTSLPRVARGFNTLCFNSVLDYEQLLMGRDGQFPRRVRESIDEYKEKLFPKINGIFLTIARIPHFEEFLPGGSQRVISANGVVTTHEVDLTRGLNQQYVRCFDLVVDVDAELNYGKSQLTNNHLVNRIRRFVNDAYATTIQTAAAKWVGRMRTSSHEEQYDVFLSRPSLDLPQLASKKEPQDENDVIALFFELLGRGYIQGYQSFGLSQSEIYDGKFTIRRSGDQTDFAPTDDRQLSTIEFKVTASSLIRDFEQGIKNPSALQLVIAWDEGSSDSNQFHFVDIEHSKHYQEDRVYPEVTRYLQDAETDLQIQVLLLKSVVEDIQEQKTNNSEKTS